MEPFWSTAAALDIVTQSCLAFQAGGRVMLGRGLVLYQAVLLLSSVHQFQEFKMDTCQLQGKETIVCTALSSMVVTVASGWLASTHFNARQLGAGNQMHCQSA